jgi:hypothetical protein
VKEETLEAMLKHSRKKLNQRTGKLLAKHGNETMGNQDTARLSEKQIAVVQRIYAKHFGDV